MNFHVPIDSIILDAVKQDYKKAVEEYKKNNVCGNNDAEIGLLLIDKEKNLQEGV